MKGPKYHITQRKQWSEPCFCKSSFDIVANLNTKEASTVLILIVASRHSTIQYCGQSAAGSNMILLKSRRAIKSDDTLPISTLVNKYSKTSMLRVWRTSQSRSVVYAVEHEYPYLSLSNFVYFGVSLWPGRREPDDEHSPAS